MPIIYRVSNCVPLALTNFLFNNNKKELMTKTNHLLQLPHTMHFLSMVINLQMQRYNFTLVATLILKPITIAVTELLNDSLKGAAKNADP